MKLARHKVMLGAGLGLLATAAVDVPARAAVTLGSALPITEDFDTCNADRPECFLVQEALPGQTTAAPFNGVIVGWSVRGTGTYSIVPVRYTGDDTAATGPGTPSQQTAPGIPVSSFQVNPGVPIQQGEHIGLSLAPGSTIGQVLGVAGADTDCWVPRPAGPTPARSGCKDLAGEGGFNAVIEPDADGDGHGDESQDGCPTSKETAEACPPPPPAAAAQPAAPRLAISGVSVARRGSLRVRFTMSEPIRVTVTISRRQGGRFRRVTSLGHDARAGANSVRIRRKLRRGSYRALVRAVDPTGSLSVSGSVTFRMPRR